MNRRDQRLADILDLHQPIVDGRGSLERLFACLQGFEDVDVGAGDERRAGADQDDGVDRGIGAGARDRIA